MTILIQVVENLGSFRATGVLECNASLDPPVTVEGGLCGIPRDGPVNQQITLLEGEGGSSTLYKVFVESSVSQMCGVV